MNQQIKKDIKELNLRVKNVRKRLGCNLRKDKRHIEEGENDEAYWDGEIDIVRAKLQTWLIALEDELRFLMAIHNEWKPNYYMISVVENRISEIKQSIKEIKESLK